MARDPVETWLLVLEGGTVERGIVEGVTVVAPTLLGASVLAGGEAGEILCVSIIRLRGPDWHHYCTHRLSPDCRWCAFLVAHDGQSR
jgi:hypothetical protein